MCFETLLQVQIQIAVALLPHWIAVHVTKHTRYFTSINRNHSSVILLFRGFCTLHLQAPNIFRYILCATPTLL